MGAAAIAIIAIMLGFIVLQPRATFAWTKPTEVRAVPVDGQPGAMDVFWRFPSYSVDDVAPRFSVTVDGTEVAEVRGNDGSAGGDRTIYSVRLTGQRCTTPLEVQVTAFNAGADLGRYPSDVVNVVLPCPPTGSPAASPTSAPPATAAPTPASTTPPTAQPEPGGLLPPTNVTSETSDPGAFIVYWDYPQEGSVAPEGFDIVVDGAVFEPSSYEGTDFEYSWYVGDQQCGTTVQVEIVAVNGDQRSSSGPVPAETGAC
jgi:hypothetical protein